MGKRIYGIETEYGLLIKDNEFRYDPVEIANRIKNHVFSKGLGVLDLHYRANDEPPGNGGFLANGGRLYLDMGHLEYASPECCNLVDLITFDRAGDQLVQEAWGFDRSAGSWGLVMWPSLGGSKLWEKKWLRSSVPPLKSSK